MYITIAESAPIVIEVVQILVNFTDSKLWVMIASDQHFQVGNNEI